VFPHGNSDALAVAIAKLRDDPKTLTEMRRRAVRAIALRHNWQSESSLLIDTYRELLPRPLWVRAAKAASSTLGRLQARRG
jgi:glycosyltransferase involved in cell wall biosynthesis